MTTAELINMANGGLARARQIGAKQYLIGYLPGQGNRSDQEAKVRLRAWAGANGVTLSFADAPEESGAVVIHLP